MQEVTLSLLVLLAGLPALDANDPEDKDSPFYYDWYRLRVGGLICAGILCAVGIIVLMSEYGALDGGENREESVCSSDCILLQQVESASASSARSPVTVQGMGHLSSHQALLTTAEDGPVEEHSTPLSQVLALEVGLNSKTAVLSSPDTALPGSHLTSLMIAGSLFSF
ncbi:FXYD domain-containing ion transport regulator 3 isoform X2 [Peromyscus californicus insignis]|nr:FXYD domain-containing ion transport regulator 3 isoform X2 [Peromyscus californicus insignis]XP_052617893.1 FXYD domain-containing ion transport regulator 3 isoform X2 [Peromyscus californicus insignis]XP_052617894.1 FXYD domain-containing ion transport regulator 3 isoform X2 [Peromyscus californicus insignis]XP_052617895.1 FXYD domain-containing ion transport regulator 3 isoform X2 [Peromyscus californicus insignis]